MNIKPVTRPNFDSPEGYIAPEGTRWRCPACGEQVKDALNGDPGVGWDESCAMHAVLVDERGVPA